MKKTHFAGRLILSAIAVAALIVVSCGRSDSSGEKSLEERLKQLEAAAPGVGEIMSNIQLHFAKLHFAAHAGNWSLAKFEIDEIEENLNKAVALRPEENGIKLPDFVNAVLRPQLNSMKQAVEQRDTTLFHQHYGETITACNACHAATGRPFITITQPVAPPVSNQQWEPAKDQGSGALK